MRNTNKNTNKKCTTKVAKPDYIVNLVGVRSEFGATLRFAMTKYENDVNNFNTSDIIAIKQHISNLAIVYALSKLINMNMISVMGAGIIVTSKLYTGEELVGIEIIHGKTYVKPNIFKRFWNWITRKK